MLSEETNAVALALLVFMQNFGGAIILAIAETVFNQELACGLSQYAPDVNVTMVEAAGATGFRETVNPAQLGGVLRAYNSAVTTEFYLAIACAAAILVVCWGMGWTDIVETKKVTTTESKGRGDHQLETWRDTK